MKQEAAARVRFADSNTSVLFDLVRGVAALLVLVSHVRNDFLVDFGSVTAHRALVAVAYTLCGAGHQAVVVFFVLSGFFISRSVMGSAAQERWSWADYLLRRLLRLWVVLLPALVLALALDWLGMRFGHTPAIYGGFSYAASAWWGTVFFLQRILVPTPGSDSALWSLSYEFWYYMLFSLGFFALRRSTPRAARGICVGLFVAVAWFVRGEILLLFPVWLAGAVLAVVPPPSFSARKGRRVLMLATPLYLACFFAASRSRRLPNLLCDYALTLATFGFLWLLLAVRDRAEEQSLGVRGSRELARFSYSLYALHLPLVVLAVSLLESGVRWQPTLRGAMICVAVSLVAVAYAYGVARVTEFRTDALRRRLELALGLASGWGQ